MNRPAIAIIVLLALLTVGVWKSVITQSPLAAPAAASAPKSPADDMLGGMNAPPPATQHQHHAAPLTRHQRFMIWHTHFIAWSARMFKINAAIHMSYNSLVETHDDFADLNLDLAEGHLQDARDTLDTADALYNQGTEPGGLAWVNGQMGKAISYLRTAIDKEDSAIGSGDASDVGDVWANDMPKVVSTLASIDAADNSSLREFLAVQGKKAAFVGDSKAVFY